MLVLIVGALVAVARHRRERWAWACLICAGIGLLFVAVNPYGNEGIFRASLFGIPWLAALAVHAFRSPSRRLGSIAWLGLTVGLVATFLVASFGMDATNAMRASDLQALRTFEREAPADSYLLNIGFGDLPSPPPNVASSTNQITYAELNDTATQASGRPVASDLVALLKRYEQKAGGATRWRAGGCMRSGHPSSPTTARNTGSSVRARASAGSTCCSRAPRGGWCTPATAHTCSKPWRRLPGPGASNERRGCAR